MVIKSSNIVRKEKGISILRTKLIRGVGKMLQI